MNFIEEYVDIVSNITDAPPVFIRGVAYYLISTLCGFKVRCKLTAQRGEGTRGDGTPPNEWFVLSGLPAITRRSTLVLSAIYTFKRTYEKILKQTYINFLIDEKSEPVKEAIEDLIIEYATPEGFLDHFTSNRYPYTMISTEYGGIINTIKKRDYMAGYLQLMSKLYYGEFSSMKLSKKGEKKGTTKKTKEKRDRNIPSGLYVTALFSMQEPHLYFDSSFIEQGFLRRILMIHVTPQEKEKFLPYLDILRSVRFDELSKYEESIAPHATKFNMPEEIIAAFPRDIEQKISSYGTTIEREFISNRSTFNLYKQSMAEHLTKLTMIHAMATKVPVFRSKEWLLDIDRNDLHSAQSFLDEVLIRSEPIITKIGSGFHKREYISSVGIMELIEVMIKERGQHGINLTDLINASGQFESSLYKIIKTLLLGGRVIATVNNNNLYFFHVDFAQKVNGTFLSTDGIDIAWNIYMYEKGGIRL